MSREYMKISASDRHLLEAMGLDSVGAVLRYASPDVAAINQTSDVVRIKSGATHGGPAVVFIKRYLYPHRSQRIKQMFRGTLLGKSRARFEYDFLNEMLHRRIPTVRPMAYGERRRKGFLRACFLITEGEEEVESLDTFALGHAPTVSMTPSERRALTRALGAAIRRMHDAGVKHGGLFWRNVLLGPLGDGPPRLLFLDPDTHGRLLGGAVPRADAIDDLSDFASSGLAFGIRGGMLGLMKSYFHQLCLSPSHREMARRIVRLAKEKAPAEQHRFAVTESIGRLRNRIVRGGESAPILSSENAVEAFFDKLGGSTLAPSARAYDGQVIHFLLRGDDSDNESLHRTATVVDKRFEVTDGLTGRANLVIESDKGTWLSIIMGRADAFGLIKSGGLRVQGDTRMLALLARHVAL